MTDARRHLFFVSYGLLVALLNLEPLRALVSMGQGDNTASHLAFIPFVSIWLVYSGRRLFFSSVHSDGRAGAGPMLVGLSLAAVARLSQPVRDHDEVLTVAIAAVVALWMGGFLLLYGRAAGRRALFPLLFLVFMIPIPGPVVDGAVFLLKTGSTELVDVLFGLTGTPHYREGFVFALPHVAIEVADECSGIRSSIGLLLTSLLAGHLFLRAGWKKWLLVGAVLPLAILKNGIRITALSLLSLHVDPEYLTGQLHHEGGIVFFLLALALLTPVLVLLRRSELAAGGEAATT